MSNRDPHDNPANRPPPLEGEIVETTSVMATASRAVMANPDMDAGLAIALSEAEINQQIATAKRYPRSIQASLDEITTLACLDTPTAIECNYALPRGKDDNGKAKTITGPSIRFAELAAQSWGNNRVAARVIAVDRKEKFIEAEGIYHDLEKNTAVCARVRRRISDSKGRLYSDDMIVVTGNAASSIALRNAILRGIPKPIWRGAYQKVVAVISGDEKTIAARRVEILEAFKRDLNVPATKVFAALGVKGVADIGPDEVVVLAGFYTALKNNEVTIDDLVREATSEPGPGGQKNLAGAYGSGQPAQGAQGGAQAGGDADGGQDSGQGKPAAQAASKPAAKAEPKKADPEPDPEQAEPKETVAGSPPADEIYLLRGDAIEEADGKRQTYKNGEAFSRVGPKGVAKLIEYTAHPGAADEDDADDDTAGAATEPTESDSDAGGDTNPDEGDAAADAGDQEVNDLAAPFSAFEDVVDQADGFADIRSGWLTLVADPAFGKVNAETQADARAYGFNRAMELLGEDEQNPRANVVLFDLWLGVAPPNEVKPAFRALIGTAEYRGLSDAEKDRIGDAVTAAVGE